MSKIDCEECGGSGFTKNGNGVSICGCSESYKGKDFDDEDMSGADGLGDR